MFGTKRRARKIQVADDNEEKGAPVPVAAAESMNDVPALSPASIKFGRRPFKGSSLRKSININDEEDTGTTAKGDEDDAERPVVIRPAISRSGSTKLKKKSSSRLSFGPGETTGEDAAPTEIFTPKKSSLSQKAAENNSFRTTVSGRLPPTRSFGAEEDRPRYSKEYLDELQSSTPNTPQNIAALSIYDDEDPMDLDPSELEGAVVVPSADLSLTINSGAAHIPTEAEIREKKERRARIALEGDAYNEDNGDYITLIPKKKKDDTRLIAEDEDLGEGYDDFVEDGRLELGKKGEKVARHRHRQEMAELIQSAEILSEEEDDDSDAERKAAYEEAQMRAAMDGLHRLDDDGANGDGSGRLIIPRMKPLPELGECMSRMRLLVQGMNDEVVQKRKRIENLEREKAEILAREHEVQEVLNQAGIKYQTAMGVKVDTEKLVAQSPLRIQISAGERGLESFGTPTQRPEMDKDM